jgi:hypothetical protein
MNRILSFAFFIATLNLSAQLINDVSIRLDSLVFSKSIHSVPFQGEPHIYFQYASENPVAEINVRFQSQAVDYSIELLPSSDYQIIDSLVRVGSRARFKVRFNQLSSSEFLKFSFRVEEGEFVALEEINLLPVYQTYATIYPGSEELFIGEEKTFEVITNNPENLRLDFRWHQGENFNHRFSRNGQQVLLHLIPTALGRQYLDLEIPTKKPRLDINEELVFNTEAIQNEFIVKEGRLAFLQLDKQEITPNDDKKEPISIQIDNHRLLRIGRTYRIEDQEQPGGPLIAEIFTKTRLNNDKVLADLRVYAYHRKSDGYLFIKDGDLARFVTNADITPKTNITSISIQRNGGSWQNGNVVYPGEHVSVRLQGEGLHKSRISFQGVSDLSYDSLVRNESIALFDMQIPVNVSNRSIEIFNYNQPTGKTLTVKEYQKPRAFDYIKLDLAGDEYVVDDIDRPIYFEKNLTDLVIEFDRSMIDGGDELFGKQYLTIDVKLSNKTGNLIEIYRFDQLEVCPGESSPRSIYYDRDNCQSDDINLNNYLTRKTHSLEEWSKIELEIAHVKDKHGGKGEKKRIQLYLKRDYNFDIDLSFPTGLLILEANKDEFINFGGPSFAMMAQFSFYQEGKIAKYKPYKFGAGFIAIDAFNLTGSGNQDIGMVVMGSLHPTTSGKKLTFPLYAGFGYFLKKQTPFFLLGPGIRVRL